MPQELKQMSQSNLTQLQRDILTIAKAVSSAHSYRRNLSIKKIRTIEQRYLPLVQAFYTRWHSQYPMKLLTVELQDDYFLTLVFRASQGHYFFPLTLINFKAKQYVRQLQQLIESQQCTTWAELQERIYWLIEEVDKAVLARGIRPVLLETLHYYFVHRRTPLYLLSEKQLRTDDQLFQNYLPRYHPLFTKKTYQTHYREILVNFVFLPLSTRLSLNKVLLTPLELQSYFEGTPALIPQSPIWALTTDSQSPLFYVFWSPKQFPSHRHAYYRNRIIQEYYWYNFNHYQKRGQYYQYVLPPLIDFVQRIKEQGYLINPTTAHAHAHAQRHNLSSENEPIYQPTYQLLLDHQQLSKTDETETPLNPLYLRPLIQFYNLFRRAGTYQFFYRHFTQNPLHYYFQLRVYLRNKFFKDTCVLFFSRPTYRRHKMPYLIELAHYLTAWLPEGIVLITQKGVLVYTFLNLQQLLAQWTDLVAVANDYKLDVTLYPILEKHYQSWPWHLYKLPSSRYYYPDEARWVLPRKPLTLDRNQYQLVPTLIEDQEYQNLDPHFELLKQHIISLEEQALKVKS